MLLADRASQSSPLIRTEPVGWSGASTMASEETSDIGKARRLCLRDLSASSNAAIEMHKRNAMKKSILSY
jgi:hypothetical protein